MPSHIVLICACVLLGSLVMSVALFTGLYLIADATAQQAHVAPQAYVTLDLKTNGKPLVAKPAQCAAQAPAAGAGMHDGPRLKD